MALLVPSVHHPYDLKNHNYLEDGKSQQVWVISPRWVEGKKFHLRGQAEVSLRKHLNRGTERMGCETTTSGIGSRWNFSRATSVPVSSVIKMTLPLVFPKE